MNDTSVRTAASVSRLLRKHGIKTGYRYTQTGYVDSKGQAFSRPGVMVSRMVHSRYDGDVEDDAVSIYLIADSSGLATDQVLANMVQSVLEAEKIPFERKNSKFRIPDEPGVTTFASDVLLKTFASLTHQMHEVSNGDGTPAERANKEYDLRTQRNVVQAEILRRMA